MISVTQIIIPKFIVYTVCPYKNVEWQNHDMITLFLM